MVCVLSLPPIHGLRAFFRLLLTPVSTTTSLPASQFTVCTSRFILEFRRVTVRGAQPSAARLSEEICLSHGSQGPLRGSLRGFCGVSAGLCRGLRGSAGHGLSEGSDPILVTLGNCWSLRALETPGKIIASTLNMTGRRFHRTTFCFHPFETKHETRERKGYKRGTAQNFLHAFPLSGTQRFRP